jgi:hypothetical protein
MIAATTTGRQRRIGADPEMIPPSPPTVRPARPDPGGYTLPRSDRYPSTGGAPSVIDLQANDTRVFLFHSANASADPSGAMDAVNQWLSKDRSATPYANLRVRNVSVTDDGRGGVYTMVVCSLGRSGQSATARPLVEEPAATTA